MYYVEKVIDGVLYYKHNPKSEWRKASISRVTRSLTYAKDEITGLRAEIAKLKESNIRLNEALEMC